jgi:hypothetical protein
MKMIAIAQWRASAPHWTYFQENQGDTITHTKGLYWWEFEYGWIIRNK